MFLGPAAATLLSRGAFIDGLGLRGEIGDGVRPQRRAWPADRSGGMFVFEPEHGRLEAIIDSRLVTEFKTAADSVLGARFLARPDSAHLLVVGAGTVARSLVKAYRALFPRPASRVDLGAAAGAVHGPGPRARRASASRSLRSPTWRRPLAEADIITSATMAREPVLRGAWIRPGTHVDLIGAYKADMREADDALISGGSLFVDSRETTIEHIGELTIPIASGRHRRRRRAGRPLRPGAGPGRAAFGDARSPSTRTAAARTWT